MAKIFGNAETWVGMVGYRLFEFFGETLRIRYKQCQLAKLGFLTLIDRGSNRLQSIAETKIISGRRSTHDRNQS